MEQEWYRTGDSEIRERAKQLRRSGCRIAVSQMGSQVTKFGRMNCTMISILSVPADFELPTAHRLIGSTY